MNRIYLKKQKNHRYIVKDCLDHKKIGEMQLINKVYRFTLKQKQQNKWLEAEARLLLKKDSTLKLSDSYIRFIQKEYPFDVDLNQYPFPVFIEACRLKKCGLDLFNRPAYLHPAAKNSWKLMRKCAEKSAIKLRIVSAFRDFHYQKRLIDNKLEKGIPLKDILKVNTLPGFSEHHTGCAIDIATPSSVILETEFDQSDAFAWLMSHAHRFDFYLSYPINNSTGILYEPWHWCYQPKR